VLNDGLLKLEKINTTENLVDILTKTLLRDKNGLSNANMIKMHLRKGLVVRRETI